MIRPIPNTYYRHKCGAVSALEHVTEGGVRLEVVLEGFDRANCDDMCCEKGYSWEYHLDGRWMSRTEKYHLTVIEEITP